MNHSLALSGRDYSPENKGHYAQQPFGMSTSEQNYVQGNLADFNPIFDGQCFEPWPMPDDDFWSSAAAFDGSDFIAAALTEPEASNLLLRNEDLWDFGLSASTTASSNIDPAPSLPQLDPEYFKPIKEDLSRKASGQKPTHVRKASSSPLASPSPQKWEGEVDSSRVHYGSEKRYRANINAKLEELNKIVPALDQFDIGSARRYSADSDKRRKSVTVNKAFVLEKAIKYIQHLESDHQEKEQRMLWLRDKVRLSLEVLQGNEKSMQAIPNQDMLREEMSLLL